MKPEILKKIEEDEDFINSPKTDNSLKKLMNKHPDGLEDSKIADVLCIKIQEVESIYQSAISKIRHKLKIQV